MATVRDGFNLLRDFLTLSRKINNCFVVDEVGFATFHNLECALDTQELTGFLLFV